MKNMPTEEMKRAVISYLIEHKITIATAESCTAGLIAAALGDVPGVSSIFAQGFVTYSNDAKEQNLGVLHTLLENYGAVSSQVAEAMAESVCKKTGARVGISATGIAGPDGGTEEKPVGLVYIGVCIDGETMVKRFIFPGNRGQVRAATVLSAFYELGKRLGILS